MAAMASRKTKIIAGGGVAVVLGTGALIYSLFAAQGQGVLAQAPLNIQVPVTPSFIMAVDDSGSMTFQTQFPGADGEGCWNTTRRSFFDASGNLYTAGNCDYQYVLPGTRAGTNWYGIPPIDTLGFSRSARYNPAYYDPSVRYAPWVNRNKASYGDVSTSNTPIDPRSPATTVSLASNYLSLTDTFRMQNGMVIPAGQRFVYGNTTYELPYDYTWDLGAANVYMRYWPATFFTPFTGNNDPYPQLEGATNAYAAITRVKVDNACGTNCAMWKYSIPSGDSEALRNFANWFAYYGNRNRSMIAGMTLSMAQVENMNVGYFRINQHGSFDSSTSASKRLTMYNMGTATDKQLLYDNMISLTASGGTPNRQAVNAAGLQFKRTDTNAPVKLSCQKNAIMLFTDGFSNGGTPSSTNNDGGMGIPFSDGNAGTMADIAASYYNTPLRTDLAAGQVPIPSACSASPGPRLDCNPDLHINFYGVTLGSRGVLYNPDITQDPYTDSSIYGNWPSAQNDNRTTVDDIWHASVNTRGEYINARTPAEITAAMRRILSSVNAGASPSGSIAMTGARIGTGSLAVTPTYEVANESTDWFSRLTGSTVGVNATTRVAEYTTAWEASARIATQSPGSRNIVAGKGNAALAFSTANFTLADLCTKTLANAGMSFCSAKEITDLGGDLASAVAYLRGETSREVRFSNGIYRTRTTLLGDIVNSSPVVSSPLDDYGYRALGGTLATSYAAFLETKKQSRRHMVYVGANDGMLHAIDGGINAAGAANSTGGNETFAYIPATAVGHIGNLLFPYVASQQGDQKFQHRYFVDGQVTVADAQIGTAWGTALVAASGAGGRSVFALDVSNPQSFTASNRLWEINDINTSLDATVRANLGFVLGKPVIVPTRTASGGTEWKAIFGNGYNSASGKAVLYVVDMNSGSVRMIEAVEGTGAPAGTNGLGNIIVVDRFATTTSGSTTTRLRGRDGMADTVYAADQRGAIWKFDLESSATSVTRPVFTTRTSTESSSGTTLTYRQPIIGGMTAVTGQGDGVMLLFGTGSFSFNGDERDSAVQSLYGVNDLSLGQPATTLTAANLAPYTVTTNSGVRGLAAGTATGATSGWTVTLPTAERFVGNPTVVSGVVFMPTYVPNQTQAGCSTEGSNWLFGLTASSGAPALDQARKVSPSGDQVGTGTAALPLNTGGTSPVKDVAVAVIPRLNSGSGPQDRACWMTVSASGADPLYIPYPCGRQSWRQLQ